MEIKRFEKELNYAYLVEVNPTQVVDYVCMDCFNVTGRRVRCITRERKECDVEIWLEYGELNSSYDQMYINDENGLIYNIELDEEPKSCLHSYTPHTCPKCGGKTYAIDVDIIPHIIELNKKGYKTEFSCSGHPHKDIRAREVVKSAFDGSQKTINRNKVYYEAPYVKFEDSRALKSFVNYIKFVGIEGRFIPEAEYSAFSVYPNKWNILNTKEEYDKLLNDFLEVCKKLPNLILPVNEDKKDEEFKLVLKDYGENTYYAVRDLETLEEFKEKMENLDYKPSCELTDEQKKTIEEMSRAFENGELTIDLKPSKWMEKLIPDYQPRLYQRMLMDDFFITPRQSGKTWAIDEFLKNKGKKITDEIDLDKVEGKVLEFDVPNNNERIYSNFEEMLKKDLDDLMIKRLDDMTSNEETDRRFFDFDTYMQSEIDFMNKLLYGLNSIELGTPNGTIEIGNPAKDIEEEIKEAFEAENEYTGIDNIEEPSEEEIARALASEFIESLDSEAISNWNLALKSNKLGLTREIKPNLDDTQTIDSNLSDHLIEDMKNKIDEIQEEEIIDFWGPDYADEDYEDYDDEDEYDW